MKKIILSFFLALTCTIGVTQKKYVFTIDSLPMQGVLLDKGWKWQAGDNPDFAKSDFDDSKWESIDPTKDIMNLPQVRQAEIGYLRLHLWIDSTLVGKAIALKLYQIGASEIYLDNSLIHKIGHASKNSNEEQTYVTDGHLYSIVFQRSGEHVISVRYSYTKSNHWIKLRPGVAIFDCFNGRLSYLDRTVETYIKDKSHFSFLSYSKLGIFLFLGLLHLFFFISYHKQNANLFVSLYAFCQSYIYYLDNDKIWGIDGNSFFVNTHLLILLNVFSTLFSLLTIYSYLKLAKNSTFWVTFLLIVVAYPICIYFNNSGWIYLTLGMSLVLEIEAIRVSVRTIHQNNSGVRYIIVGWVIYTLFMGLFILMVFGVLPSFVYGYDISFNIAVLSVPICYSLMLASDYARTNQILLAKLNEVEILSAEKQQILATQNETLEKQVVQRTAELQSTQAQLIQKEKLASLGELTAGIAHEIQNPLNFVNNFSELSVGIAEDLKEELKNSPLTPNGGIIIEDKAYFSELISDLTQNQEKINHHGKRASSIVKGMLEHSRMSTGERQLTDLNALCDEYLRLSYHGMRAKDKNFNADYELITDPDLPKVNVVPQDIGRVLLNLINNAFYAAYESKKSQPKVIVSSASIAQSDGSTVIIRVKDNGTGIPKENLAKIFQPFFTTKPTGEGTGLGLSLAYDIITKGHGGTIEVESVESEGTTFMVYLSIF
ncbi:MAG: ATP-binding protein [Spirosomataceae bacterium]